MHDRLAGHLEETNDGFAFTYDPVYLPNGEAVSLTLPVRLEPYTSPTLFPFFQGLRKTQARITALMMRIDRFAAGERLIQAGETGDEMYVVIDGELQAFLDTESGRIDL